MRLITEGMFIIIIINLIMLCELLFLGAREEFWIRWSNGAILRPMMELHWTVAGLEVHEKQPVDGDNPLVCTNHWIIKCPLVCSFWWFGNNLQLVFSISQLPGDLMCLPLMKCFLSFYLLGDFSENPNVYNVWKTIFSLIIGEWWWYSQYSINKHMWIQYKYKWKFKPLALFLSIWHI